MDSLQFCYWLKGWLELADPQELSRINLDVIKDHLELVFTKVTPDRSKFNDYSLSMPFCSPQIINNPHESRTYWGNKGTYYSLEQINKGENLWKLFENNPCPSC